MEGSPIPARLIGPWIADNAVFVRDVVKERRRQMESLREKRAEKLRDGKIMSVKSADRATLAAVDAAVVDVPLGDILSILIQVVHVDDAGMTMLGTPVRASGISGNVLSLARTPMRIVTEMEVLSQAETITIADTSFWSLLMEVNQAITRNANNSSDRYLSNAVDSLVRRRLFLETISNPNVIAMSKSNQACRVAGPFVSDREAYGQILEPGEYIVPGRLTEETDGKFGVEHRGFNDAERDEVQDTYERQLGVVYFKPHPWSRAFRIEARLSLLSDEAWLMPLLNAVAHHTRARSIIEPWPQFMADWTAKQIAAVAKLYGDMNFHRVPHLDPARTQ